MAGGRALVVSSNLDANFAPIGNGIVTAIDPKTMQVLGTATMGGTNSTDAAVGPDGLLYVVNTGDFVAQGSLTIVNPATMQVVRRFRTWASGPARSASTRTGWRTSRASSPARSCGTRRRARSCADGDNPVCAKLANGSCRGAFAATTNAAGDVYQVFFGSSTQNLPPYIFVFKAGTFALSDSINAGVGPSVRAHSYVLIL